MFALRWTVMIALTAAALVAPAACNIVVTPALPTDDVPADQSAPDGIDPANPNVERSTQSVDFSGVRTIRIQLPTGRVVVSQAAGEASATLKVTEVVLAPGLAPDVLEDLLTAAEVTAGRSFVDDQRLDIRASVPGDLGAGDIAFEVRLVIPSPANMEIFLQNGPVDVVNVSGNVEIATANGAILLDHVDGSAIARTTKRPIDVVEVTGHVSARTSEAPITMRLAPPAGARIAAITTRASVRLTMAKATAASISLRTEGGVVAANLAGFNVTDILTSGGLLTAVLNGGGGQIDAQTTQGDIEFVGM